MAWLCRSVGTGADMESCVKSLDDRIQEDGASVLPLFLAMLVRKFMSVSEGYPEHGRLFLTQRRHAGIASSHCERYQSRKLLLIRANQL